MERERVVKASRIDQGKQNHRETGADKDAGEDGTR